MPNAPMTEAELAEIEARCEAATPGPWYYMAAPHKEVGRPDIERWRLWAGRRVSLLDGYVLSEDDADLMAGARTEIPALAAALRRSWAENADLKAKVQQLQRDLVDAKIASGEWNP